MEPAIKKVVAVLAVVLIVVIGLIFVTRSAKKDEADTTLVQENQNIDETNPQTDETTEPLADDMPTDGAQASNGSVTDEAPLDDKAHEDELYEGALAGLSEEEIAAMALAEESSAARTEMTGVEDAMD